MNLSTIANVLVKEIRNSFKKKIIKENFVKISPSGKAVETQNKIPNKNLLKAGYLMIKRNLQDRQQIAKAYSVFVQALAFEASSTFNIYRKENEVFELVQLILSQIENNFEIYFDDDIGVFRKASPQTDEALRNHEILMNKYRRFLKLGSELPDELRQRFMDSISLEAHRNNNNLPCEKIEECENFDEIFQFFVRMPEIRINLIYSRIVAETNSSQNQ